MCHSSKDFLCHGDASIAAWYAFHQLDKPFPVSCLSCLAVGWRTTKLPLNHSKMFRVLAKKVSPSLRMPSQRITRIQCMFRLLPLSSCSRWVCPSAMSVFGLTLVQFASWNCDTYFTFSARVQWHWNLFFCWCVVGLSLESGLVDTHLCVDMVEINWVISVQWSLQFSVISLSRTSPTAWS